MMPHTGKQVILTHRENCSVGQYSTIRYQLEAFASELGDDQSRYLLFNVYTDPTVYAATVERSVTSVG